MRFYWLVFATVAEEIPGKYTEAFKWVFAICFALWAGLKGVYQALIVCMIFDFGFGVAAHLKRKDLNLDKSLWGFCRKILMLFLTWGFHLMGDSLMRHIGQPLDFDPAVVLAGGFLVTELKSLIIHCAALEIILPSYVITWIMERAVSLQPKPAPHTTGETQGP